MITLETYPTLLIQRTEFLTVLVLLSLFISPLAERGPFAKLVRAGASSVARLGAKLNRENRSVATLVYRGIVAVIMLLLPSIILGALFIQHAAWAVIPITLSVLLWFGYCYATTTTYTLWRQAKNNTLALQLPETNYLFSDSHAVIRYTIATRMDAFAVGVVGGCFWYVVGGWMAMAIYLTLAAANNAFGKHLAFGWAARSLFRLLDAVPRVLARIIIALAALIVPHCHPIDSILAPNWRMAAAKALGVSLGGRSPRGVESWVGSGKARVTHQHLWRMGYLVLVATLVLIASSKSYNLLLLLYN